MNENHFKNMKNKHIPLEEMLSDLEITNREIAQYESENEVLMKDFQRNRIAIYLNDGRIGERKTFVNDLEKIIKEIYPDHKF